LSKKKKPHVEDQWQNKNHNLCGAKTTNLEDLDGKAKEKESKYGRRRLRRRRYNRIMV
jgi:hypothetical protein